MADTLAILKTLYEENKDKIELIPPHPFNLNKANQWVNSQPEKYKLFCSLFLKYQIHVSGQEFLENIGKLGADIVSRIIINKYNGIIVCSSQLDNTTKSSFWVLLLLYKYIGNYIVAVYRDFRYCYEYILDKPDFNYLIIVPDDMTYSGIQISETFDARTSSFVTSTDYGILLKNEEMFDDSYIEKLIQSPLWPSRFQFNMESDTMLKRLLKLKNKTNFFIKIGFGDKSQKITNTLDKLIIDGFYQEPSIILLDKIIEETDSYIRNQNQTRYLNISSKIPVLIACPYISTVAKKHIISVCESKTQYNIIPVKFSDVSKVIIPLVDLFRRDEANKDMAISYIFKDQSNNCAIYFDHKLADHISSWTKVYDTAPVADENGDIKSFLGTLIENCKEPRCPTGFYKQINYTYHGKSNIDQRWANSFCG